MSNSKNKPIGTNLKGADAKLRKKFTCWLIINFDKKNYGKVANKVRHTPSLSPVKGTKY